MPGKTIKILSWNIQKFGTKKSSTLFIKYVASVIIEHDADFVGIMEIVGWNGEDLKNKLVIELHNVTGVNWAGEESEMTPSKPNEQYIFLYKKDLVKKLNQRLYTVISENAFDEFFAAYPALFPNDAAKGNFWDEMKKVGYLDDNYQVPDHKRTLLQTDPNNLDLTPIFSLTPSQKAKLVDVLLGDDAIGFPHVNSRPPFLAKTLLNNLGGSDVNLPILLYHAPGPGNTSPLYASNNLAYIDEIRTASKGVVMGDFNIKKNEFNKTISLEAPIPPNNKMGAVKDGSGSKVLVKPFQTLTGPNLTDPPDPITRTFLGYKKAFDETVSTSLKESRQKNFLPDDISIKNLRSSPYDNIFTKGFSAVEVKKKEVVPLIDELIPKTSSHTTTPYNSSRATLAKDIFNEWWDQQNAKVFKSTFIKTTPKFTTLPANLEEAHYAYKEAISDHLPVFIELEYA